jgi:hypothetical protein
MFHRILLLPCWQNILYFRSEAGRTDRWAQAHFFVGPVGGQWTPALLGESLVGFGKNSGSRRACGAAGRARNI